MGRMTLGIDVACRAAHQASLADEAGRFAWSGRRFRTCAADLEQLWAWLPAGAELTVVMEPTRNAWVPLAAWFRRRGATVVLVPAEQSADLREYYSKHTKSDRLDSRLLARVPLAPKRPALSNPVLDVEHQPAGVIGGGQHVLAERQEPLHVAVGMYPAVGTGVCVGWAREPQVNRCSR
jgi:transposase